MTLYLPVLTLSHNVNVFLNLNFISWLSFLVFYSGVEAAVLVLSVYNILEELKVSKPSKQAISIICYSRAVTEKITPLCLACALRFLKKCALEMLAVACE